MKTLLKLMLIAMTSTLLLISCSSDDDNNPTNNNNSDAPMSCNISGAYDINFEAGLVYYDSVPDEDDMTRTITGYMDHEGKSHVLIIALTDPNGDYKKEYDLNPDMAEAYVTFLYDMGDGLPPESYNLDVSGKINFSTLTDSKAIGTFNCVIKTLNGSKQITISNGIINKK
jgi:hypothetical protein